VSEVIENIAKLLEKPLSELGRDIYTIAAFCEEKGNKGYTVGQIEQFAKAEKRELPTYFLKEEYEAIYLDILFYKREDRHSDFYGWMIRKRPNWRIGWRTLWGREVPELKTVVDEWESAETKKAEEEAAKPKRKNERFPQGDFESFTTIQIAYRAACMDVLYQRYERRYHQQRVSEWKDSPAGYLHNIYRQQWFLLIEELSYRTQGSPDPKHYRSKKALTAAVADFEKAKDFIERVEAFGFEQFNPKDITGYFFSPGFVTQAITSAEEPDLRVDMEHLPKQPVESGVVRWMPDYEVVTAFMKFLDEDHDPKSFEYEDKKNILATLRRLLANAKGQRATDDVIKIGDTHGQE
jgi:hypothetical protein